MQTDQDGWNDYPIGWIPDDSNFGARLALIRQRMAWGNVKEAALACGVPVESWRSWERDGAYPRRIDEISQKIADRTGADYFWVMTGDMGPRKLAMQQQQVRHQGLEPRTRWFEASTDRCGLPRTRRYGDPGRVARLPERHPSRPTYLIHGNQAAS